MPVVAPIWQFVALLTVHWIADFVLQTSWQASNKSKRLDALSRHVAVYTAILGLTAILLFPFSFVHCAAFTALNGSLHFATDLVTSRISAKFHKKEDWHSFFMLLGFDQLVHQVTLALTMWLIYYHE
jgi:hypothetical protein